MGEILGEVMNQAVPIFVISLATARLRRARIQAHLDQLGLAYDLVDAVDGRLLSEEERTALGGSQGAMPPGVIGCYLSHMKVYQTILDRNLPAALILEDDARLPSAVVPLIMSGPISHDFDYLFFDCETFNHMGPVFYDAGHPLDLGHGFTAFPLSGGPESTHALMITASAARARMACALPMRQPIDIYDHLPCTFRFSAMTRPKGAYLSEDSLVSLIVARDKRARRPRLAALRRFPAFWALRDLVRPARWRSAALAREWVRTGKLSADGRWRPLPSGRNILEVTNAELDREF